MAGTIKDIVDSYTITKSDIPINGFALIEIALDGYREAVDYGCDPGITTKTVQLPVSDLSTVNYPEDYEQYIAIGVPVGTQLWTLTLNRTLLPPESILGECSVSYEQARNGAVTSVDELGGFHFRDIYTRGGLVPNMYALGGGWNSRGYFKDFPSRRQFILSGVATDEVILMYMANNVSRDTIIPSYLHEAIRRYLDWRVEDAMPDAAINRLQYRESVYYDALRKAKANAHPFRIDEWLDSYAQTTHKSIKR